MLYADTQRFAGGLLRRKAGRQLERTPATVLELTCRENTREEAFAKTRDGSLDPFHLNQINANR